MKKPRRVYSDMREFCQSVHEDDGIDPRQYFRNELEGESSSKCRRYCGYVAKTLNAVLAGCTSVVLTRIFIIKVMPAPTLGRLEVIVDTTQVEADVTSEVIRRELDQACPHLRSEIARTIMRKYVPELHFRLAAPGEVLR